MKVYLTIIYLIAVVAVPVLGQKNEDTAITKLIADYAQSRETMDTTLLKSIITADIDQLVSSGEWRRGKEGAFKGMMRSSSGNPGTRTLTVENIRMLNPKNAIVDARYEINQSNGSVRKMWSTFVVVKDKKQWKISAIRNMLPAAPSN
ncbi:MAG: DUF4440 domain-containing protein [Bacteroidota bacterium]